MASRVIKTHWESENEREYIAACEDVRLELELLKNVTGDLAENFAQLNKSMERFIELSGQVFQRSSNSAPQ